MTKPLCNGRKGYHPCKQPVHPGYVRCPWCDHFYTRQQLDAALALPQNASFRPFGWVAPADPQAVPGVWPDEELERRMLADADDDNPFIAHELGCHVKALLCRVRELESELKRLKGIP